MKTDPRDYYYIPQPGSVGYSFIVRCPDCGAVNDSLELDENRKVENADYMYYNWYVNKIEWERVTREYEQAQSRCQCQVQWTQLRLPGLFDVYTKT